MSSVQMFLVIGGLVLISILTINYYSISGVQQNTKISNEAAITGIGIGQSLLEEMARKAFDEKTINLTMNKTDSLTAAGSLGPETGETNRSLFDDLDDYNNYASYDSLGGLNKFFYKIQIYYTVKFDPEQKSNSKTFTKRADIAIKNAFMQDTLKLNYIFTY